MGRRLEGGNARKLTSGNQGLKEIEKMNLIGMPKRFVQRPTLCATGQRGSLIRDAQFFYENFDAATYRAPRLGSILTLGSLQSLWAAVGRAFSATSNTQEFTVAFWLSYPSALSTQFQGTSCARLRNVLFRGVLFAWQEFRLHAAILDFTICAHPWAHGNLDLPCQPTVHQATYV